MSISISGLGPGIDYMIMQSDSDADKVIKIFEDAISKGYHPVEIEQEVYRQAHVDPSNFTWYDKERIQRKVSEAYAAHYNERG